MIYIHHTPPHDAADDLSRLVAASEAPGDKGRHRSGA
jgi:hypothetical protein